MLLSLKPSLKFSLSKASLLLLSTAYFSLISIYIPEYGMKISLQSLPLVIGGWYFNLPISLLNSLLGNLITFLLNPQNFSLLFSIQPFLISLISSFFKKIYEEKRDIQYPLYGFSYIPLIALNFILKNHIISILTIFFISLNILSIFLLKRKNPSIIPLYINISSCFLIISYIVSLGLGTILSKFIDTNISPLISLNARAIKEIIKVSVFTLPTVFFLNHARSKER